MTKNQGKRLAEAIRNRLNNHGNLNEGVIDSVVSHITDILSKSSSKRMKRELADLAKSSTEGAKAVDFYLKARKNAYNNLSRAERKLQAMGIS